MNPSPPTGSVHATARDERGSLALEQVLFIGAVITMSLGVFAFYENIATYFRTVSITALPTQISGGTSAPPTPPN